MDVVAYDDVIQKQKKSRHLHPYRHEILYGYAEPEEPVTPDIGHSPEYYGKDGHDVDHHFVVAVDCHRDGFEYANL